jgi:hypothetical protein
MTKLEEKLKELEYKKIKTIYFEEDDTPVIIFEKPYCFHASIYIELFDDIIENYYIKNDYNNIVTQQAIDNLQQAFNVMQKDLDVLRKC